MPFSLNRESLTPQKCIFTVIVFKGRWPFETSCLFSCGDDVVILRSSLKENKILKRSSKSREYIQKKETWTILRSFGYISLISDPDISW